MFMTMASISSFIQDGVSQAAAYVGGLGSTVLNATAPALFSRVGDVASEIISVAAGREAVAAVGMYSLAAVAADVTQATTARRIGVGAMYLSIATLFYLSQGASWHFCLLAGGAVGGLDPVGLGPRLVALQPAILGALPDAQG